MKHWTTSPYLHTVLLLVLLAAALFIRTQEYNWIQSLRYEAFDTYNILYPRTPTDEVVVVDIDEASLSDDRLGQWPWPRSDVAKMVDTLSDMGAKVIVFDIVFAEKDRTAPALLIENLDLQDSASKNLLQSLPDPDRLLADSIKKAGNVVTAFPLSNNPEATRRLPTLSRPVVTARNVHNFADRLISAQGVTTNIGALEQSAAGNGSMSLSPEIDGIIRRIPLFYNIEGTIYPSLALEALRVAENLRISHKIRALRNDELSYLSSPLLLKTGRYEIPMDETGLFYVHYSKKRPAQYISAWKVIEGDVAREKIEDKIVLIGTSAEGLRDIRSTPLDLYTAGVEGHLNVIEQIIQGHYITRPVIVHGAELIFTGIIGLIMIFLALYTGAVLLAALAVTMISAISVSSVYLYLNEGLLLDPVYPSLTILFMFIVSSLFSYMRAERERRAVRQAFGLYISPDYIKELSRNPDQLKLGGETREVTVMFSDIRNFTSICEPLQPDEIISLMNDFLTPISDSIMSHKGTIDKYIGDAVMAFWNAPLPDESHARNACISALDIQERLKSLNKSLADQGRDIVLRAGIGLNTGQAAVGNMGSKQRFAYSVLGDSVNLSSRLEGYTKIYGVNILLNETVQEQAPEIPSLELDIIKVKGKKEPAKIYTLLGFEKPDHYHDLQACQDTMLALYRDRDFKKALKALKDCQKIAPDILDNYYDMMESRIKDMIKNPPAKSWDGVFIAG